ADPIRHGHLAPDAGRDAMTNARYDEFAESTAAYALGALDPQERAQFEAHLHTCDVCQTDIRAFSGVTVGLAETVERIAPPPALKVRVIAAATAGARVRPFERSTPSTATPPVMRPAAFPWLALAASLALAAAAGAYAWM